MVRQNRLEGGFGFSRLLIIAAALCFGLKMARLILVDTIDVLPLSFNG